MKRLLAFALAFVVFNLTLSASVLKTESIEVAPQASAPTLKKYEMRGVWLTTNYGLDWPSRPARDIAGEQRQQRELLWMLDQLKEAGINTIFLQVRGRGTVIYPSRIEPFSPDFASPGYTLTYDPLSFAIEEAKKRGMSVHAWLAVIPIGNDKLLNTLPKHAYALQNRKDCVKFRGGWYMDPASPATSKHMRKLVAELLEHYDLAGIHLDYIRYPDNARTFPDQKTYRAKGGNKALEEWRRSNIETIVREVSEEIKAHSATVMHSVAVLPAYREIPGRRHGWTSYNEGFQDPVAWGNKGYIDFVVPMMYNKGERFTPFVEDWNKVMSVPVIMGLGAYRVLPNEGRWSAEDVLNQINELNHYRGINGSVLFRAQQIIERNRGLWQPLRETWGNSLTYPINKGNKESETLDLRLLVDGTDEGLRISWYGAPNHTYAIYMTRDGAKPDLDKDLYMVTTRQSVTIPWMELRYDELITIRVGAYNMTTGVEELEIQPAVYYYSIFEK